MDIGLTVRLDTPFAETVERVRAALKDQGFGKLGEQLEDYLILGA